MNGNVVKFEQLVQGVLNAIIVNTNPNDWVFSWFAKNDGTSKTLGVAHIIFKKWLTQFELCGKWYDISHKRDSFPIIVRDVFLYKDTNKSIRHINLKFESSPIQDEYPQELEKYKQLQLLLQVFNYLDEKGFLVKKLFYPSELPSYVQNEAWKFGSYFYITHPKMYLSASTRNIFVARAFRDPATEPAYKVLAEEINNAGFVPIMLEAHAEPGNLDLMIKNYIAGAFLVICDVTPRPERIVDTSESINAYNLNVLYEAGMAVGFGREVLYIKNKSIASRIKDEKLPFDISSHQCIEYESKTLETKFRNTIKEILAALQNKNKLQ